MGIDSLKGIQKAVSPVIRNRSQLEKLLEGVKVRCDAWCAGYKPTQQDMPKSVRGLRQWIRSNFNVTQELLMEFIHAFQQQSQLADWFYAIVSGDLLTCLAMDAKRQGKPAYFHLNGGGVNFPGALLDAKGVEGIILENFNGACLGTAKDKQVCILINTTGHVFDYANERIGTNILALIDCQITSGLETIRLRTPAKRLYLIGNTYQEIRMPRDTDLAVLKGNKGVLMDYTPHRALVYESPDTAFIMHTGKGSGPVSGRETLYFENRNSRLGFADGDYAAKIREQFDRKLGVGESVELLEDMRGKNSTEIIKMAQKLAAICQKSAGVLNGNV